MFELFKGWRRKGGCVALLMALISMGVWLRSRHIVEVVTSVSEHGRRQSLALTPDAYEWIRHEGSGQSVAIPRFMNVGWESIDARDAECFKPGNGWRAVWNWEFVGFQFGRFELGVSGLILGEIAIWKVPHFGLALSLSMLSAYLIFWPQGILKKEGVSATRRLGHNLTD